MGSENKVHVFILCCFGVFCCCFCVLLFTLPFWSAGCASSDSAFLMGLSPPPEWILFPWYPGRITVRIRKGQGGSFSFWWPAGCTVQTHSTTTAVPQASRTSGTRSVPKPPSGWAQSYPAVRVHRASFHFSCSSFLSAFQQECPLRMTVWFPPGIFLKRDTFSFSQL